MYDFLISIKDQFNFYSNIIKFFIYFCVGAILLYLVRLIFSIVRTLLFKINKELIVDKIKVIINLFIFIAVAILIGWAIISILTSNLF
jgi:hypothetical protein